MELRSWMLKLYRARMVITEFIEATRTWRDGGFYEIVPYGNLEDEADPEVRVQWRIRVRNPVPTVWGPMVGDIVGSMRSALDHALYEVAMSSDDDVDESVARAIQFPIVDPDRKPTTVANLVARFRHLLSDETVALLEGAQTSGDELSPLVTLARISNADKHRQVIVAPAGVLNFTFTADVDGFKQRQLTGRAIQDNMVIADARFPRLREGNTVNTDGRVEWIECIEPHQGAEPIPAGLILELMYVTVFDTCVELTRPFTTADERVFLAIEAESRDQRIKSTLEGTGFDTDRVGGNATNDAPNSEEAGSDS